MLLTEGTRLGPFEVVSPLGAGGMGEVYRARDTRLDRDVAIKVLPEAMARDPERVARFSREAKLLAALNHPNIASVYGFEQSEDLRFLVMELVEGPTLVDQLKEGPLPLGGALQIGKQIAEAIDAAHDRGVVHRDLKPGNVKLTPEGQVKVLDFGLAKALAEDGDASSLSGRDALLSPTSPTITANYTRPGVILGTAAYMSPEQARGKPLDKRTDIWSFGCVLYECLGGRRPFAGETTTDMVARILERDPDWSALPSNLPANVQALLRRCLSKDRKDRLRDIGDAVIELRDALATRAWLEGEDQAASKASRATSRLGRAIGGIVLLTLGLSIGFGLSRFAGNADVGPLVRASILPPDGTRFVSVGELEGYGRVSPDGTRIAFVARDEEGKELLWVRSLTALGAHALPSTENARNPFWSPDGASLGFFANGKLKRIDIGAGSAITLADAPNGRGGAWGPNGVILFTPDFRTPVFRVSGSGGDATPATELDPTRHTTHRWPHWLPDGEHFLYLAANHDLSRAENNTLFMASLEGGSAKPIMHTSGPAIYASGYLLSVRGDTLMAQPFDPATGALSGHPSSVADKVQADAGSWCAAYSVSTNGVLAYHGGAAPGAQLTWLDRATGSNVPITEERELYATPNLSPDDRRVAIARGNPGDIWVYDLDRDVGTRLTRDPAYEWSPVWSPDGQRIAYCANFTADGKNRVYVRASNGTGDPELVVQSQQLLAAMDWSPDGENLVYWEGAGFPNGGYWIKRVDSDDEPTVLLQAPMATGGAAISPDGRWIAYSSNESGQEEVYVAPFAPPAPGSDAAPSVVGGKYRISTAGGREPLWREDGGELFYVASGATLMAVEVGEAGDGFEVGNTITVGPISATRLGVLGTSYDVSSNGQRFIFASVEGEQGAPITLVLNWPAGIVNK